LHYANSIIFDLRAGFSTGAIKIFLKKLHRSFECIPAVNTLVTKKLISPLLLKQKVNPKK
jgi:hypothetical protein